MIGSFYLRLPFSYKKITERNRKLGENSKENDGLSEESRADGQQKKNEPSHDQKGVKAYDEQKRIL